MSYSLDDFCGDARAILQVQNDPEGRERVRENLERLLSDPGFYATYLKHDEFTGARQIYQDSELDFCVLTYNMKDARTSPPHDHGQSWAIYGQVTQHTDMTRWAAESSAPGEGKSDIKPTATFRLEPGQAGLFEVREIHSIDYAEGSKFVRVTGVDMSHEARRVFDPDTGAVKEIENVGTGAAR